MSIATAWLVTVSLLLGGCASSSAARLDISQNDASWPIDEVRGVTLVPAGVYEFINEGDPALADMILEGIWPVDRYEPVDLGLDLSWTEDPYGEGYWRFVFYSLRPTRHLLAAYADSGDSRYLDVLVQILGDFIDSRHESPFADDLHGTAYRGLVLTSALVNLRAANAAPKAFDRRLLAEIADTARFLEDEEHFQVLHNHGITQAVALIAIGYYFPELEGSESWYQLGLDRVAETLALTIGTDGVQIENSPFYHFYVLRLCTDWLHWMEQNGLTVPTDVTERLDAMMAFATYIVRPDGSVPILGSSVALDARRFDASISGALSELDDEFAYVASAGFRGSQPDLRSVLFEDSGLAVLRSGFGPPEELPGETHIVVDVGEYRTKHSQLDALSLTLYSAGQTLIPDAGLFTYEEGPEADWFESTVAHNTVVVDWSSQSASGGVTASRPIAAGSWAYQSGSHQLYEGVTHRRDVLLLKKDVVVVTDHLTSEDSHFYSQVWHFEPNLRLTDSELNTVLFDRAGRSVLQIIQGGTEATRSSIGSWQSAEYEKRVVNEAVAFTVEGSDVDFVTLLLSGDYASAEASADYVDGGELGELRVCLGDEAYSIAIDSSDVTNPVVEVDRMPACVDGS